ncbi:pyridoxamine 5'-phosphate oxidase [Rhizobium lusitanum]|uniref:Pyridoxamine 5'-phosphate oxidase n=1 Tax=Rhizobium lusitanum TaxID=293958 RepID=A0A6L9U9Y3_9HYPH|nr:pyridoxamine 5'-phosphate oxidase family protein [Rhizobium lusitanum]NEI72189.1 pyridoxamine 5'-phosphate oxidase [Rhizobium lusitanum]
MSETNSGHASDIAFSPIVKAIQVRKGSRRAYERMETGGSWQTAISTDLKAFIESRTTAFLATANAEGQPYVQHRGGPPGFLRVLDTKTIAFVDFAGNRQYITQGNLEENPKAHLFLIDYAYRQRVKIWGKARVVEGDEALAGRLFPEGYKARVEQVILFDVAAWDANCPQHIPQMFEAAAVQAALAEKDGVIARLEQQIHQLELERNRAASAQQ